MFECSEDNKGQNYMYGSLQWKFLKVVSFSFKTETTIVESF